MGRARGRSATLFAIIGPSMMRRLAFALIIVVSAAACGDLSPAEPTAVDREPVLTASPIRPMRFNASILYSPGYTFTNPKPAIEPITVTRVEFRILGADGSVYAITEDPTLTFGRTATLQPGQFRSGSGSMSDANTARPTATEYTVRVLFTRSDGSTWKMEEQSTILPLM
jgi:hypothetical protein